MLNWEKLSITPEQKEKIKGRIDDALNKPFVVVVMGQTGVGKSSLVNSLFGIKFKTNDIQPETKVPELHVEKSGDGYELWFWDMPGIGESSSADAEYLNNYREKILEADVALWLCHADSRSVTLDIEAIHKILYHLPESEQSILLSKLTFVLSKADLITPEPWILYKKGRDVIFDATEETEKLLDAKAAYFKNSLIAPYKHKFLSKTFHDGIFDLKLDNFTSDKYFVYYSGVMSLSTLNRLKKDYPKYTGIFIRLYENSDVIYCSSRFRYNLAKLMSVIVNKIGGEASLRFGKFISKDMNHVSWDKARTFSNIVAYDAQKDKVIFDLSKI